MSIINTYSPCIPFIMAQNCRQLCHQGWARCDRSLVNREGAERDSQRFGEETRRMLVKAGYLF